jgi:hypothetical protein
VAVVVALVIVVAEEGLISHPIFFFQFDLIKYANMCIRKNVFIFLIRHIIKNIHIFAYFMGSNWKKKFEKKNVICKKKYSDLTYVLCNLHHYYFYLYYHPKYDDICTKIYASCYTTVHTVLL